MFTDVDKKAHSDRGVQKLAVKFDVLSEVICRVAELKTQDAKQVELGGGNVISQLLRKRMRKRVPWLTGRMGLG